MKRYFLHLAYNGASYRGWQQQANVPTVQETIKLGLGKLLSKPVKIMGCGRTDAQVHASQYFLHFNYEKELPEHFIYKINKMLPFDIAVYDVIEVDRHAHVQRDAIARTYDYYIHTQKTPFIETISSYYLFEEWNPTVLNQAIELIAKQKDFRSLCLSPDSYDSTICDLKSLSLHFSENEQRLKVSISADRFLQCMVRFTVGSLLALAQNKISLEELETGLKTGLRPAKIKAAYPQGLYLSRVEYPYLKLDPQPNMSYHLDSF